VSPFVGLTHLRALAIVLVLVYHQRLFAHPAWIDRVGAFGWTGVDLFFVLSGFLIARQILGTVSLRVFFVKRALRILPAYLTVLACYAVFPSTHERGPMAPLWKYLTFTQNLGLDLRTAGTFSHAWSLCIEEQFYLALPLIVVALRAAGAWRRGPWLLAAIFALGFIARAVAWDARVAPLAGDDGFDLAWYTWIYYPTWSRLDGLLVGIALASIVELRPSWQARFAARGSSLLVVAIALWAVAWWAFVEPDGRTASIVAFPAIALVYGLLVWAALTPSCVLARRSWWVTDRLAKLSYPLYLTHKAAIHLAQPPLIKVGLAPDGTPLFLCCVALALGAALALHLAVERPLLRWRVRLS